MNYYGMIAKKKLPRFNAVNWDDQTEGLNSFLAAFH